MTCTFSSISGFPPPGASARGTVGDSPADSNFSSDEPLIEFDEEAEPDLMDDEDDQPGGGEDPDNAEPNDDNVVVSGDANAAAAAKEASKNTVTSEKDKKVPNDKRTTTPYMTKYEKARVLGTRALQIR